MPKLVKLPESEVSFLFAFALGMVAGLNAQRERGEELREPTLDGVPQGFSLAGGALDTAAGDAVLRTDDCSWFLLELKRGFVELQSERRKQRIERLWELVNGNCGAAACCPLLGKAATAHRFLYLGTARTTYRPQMVTLSYHTWLRACLLPSPGRLQFTGNAAKEAEVKKTEEEFVSFLRRPLPRSDGFTREELLDYIDLMNPSRTESDSEDNRLHGASEPIAAAIDTAGVVTVVLYNQLLAALQPQKNSKSRLNTMKP